VLEPQSRFCPFCGLAVTTPRRRIGPGSEVALRDESGADFAKCVVGHVIGEGGMGVVYRGWLYYNPTGRLAPAPSHPVALKVLHPLIRGRARAERLFKQEAQLLAQLSHPNIVHCSGLFDQDGELCLVMELVQGESLLELIQRAHRATRALPVLPYAQAWHYFAQLLGALESIHALGIVHRDVKSANVLVRTDGILKLTDFGIARLPQELARESGGMAPGTGAYMAPEQVLGQPLDARADLYSAAIVMFEMLTGTTPFDSPERTELAVRAAQIDEPPPPISKIVLGAGTELDLVLARALAKNRDLRYDSARALGEALRGALHLPMTPGWQAQQELSKVAKTISMALPQVGSDEQIHKLPETLSDPPPAPAAAAAPVRTAPLAQAQADAERYRTDVMTGFKR
jgi:serine/threonine-protein kinase